MIAIIFVVLLIGIIIGLPIASAIGVAALAGNYVFGMDLPFSMFANRCFAGIDSFSIMAIPFFILAGELMGSAGITKKVLDMCEALLGHLKAGLSYVSCLSAMIMASISGNGTASAAALGSTLIPEMKRRGYGQEFSVALVSCANVVGPIIPPSNLMILFSFFTGASIIRLFVGGVLPGILIGVSLMILGAIICRKKGYAQEAKKFDIRHVLITLKSTWYALLVPIFLFVSIVAGWCTATESGAIVSFVSLIMGLILKTIRSWKDILDALKRAASSTCVIFSLLSLSGFFSTILVRAQFTKIVENVLTGITSSGTIAMILISLFVFILGMFVDTTAMITMLSVPFATVVLGMGGDITHLGVLMAYICMVGAVTPPVGGLLFVTAAIGKTTLTKVIPMLLPMFILLVVIGIVMVIFPQLTLFLPNLLLGAV